MQAYPLPITQNPLKTKRDLQTAFTQIVEPLEPFFTPSCARLHLDNFSAHYADDVAGMEGFSRLLWGFAPFLAGGGSSPVWEKMRAGIIHGTDPKHPEYWGDIFDYDQRIVEMAAYGFALITVPDRIWEPLTEERKRNFAGWLGQINTHKASDNNWLLFAVLVNLGFKTVGLPYDKRLMEANLDRVDTFYLKDGWYADGPAATTHRDYYIAFAIHFYTLIYAKAMEKEDPVRSARYKARAGAFAKTFISWFSSSGAALPYGRSQIYRFAQSAFWGALAYAGVDTFEPGVLKGLVLRSLRWWSQRPIFTKGGVLTVGYGYPNLVMAEGYNSPGSPYWALKAFLPLILDDSDPFWQSEEQPLPELPEKTVVEAPHMVVCRKGAHVAAFNAGNSHTKGHTHTSDKYEKFVYSTEFGFSVLRAEYGLDQGAYDSMLALSEGDNLYRAKRTGRLLKLTADEILTEWEPWPDVTVRTWLLPGLPWHVRVHAITSARVLEAADGGFALGLIKPKADERQSEKALRVVTELGQSGVKPLFGEGKTVVVYPNPDTNYLNPRTVLPFFTFRVQPGRTVLAATAFYGVGADAADEWDKAPEAKLEDGRLMIYDARGRQLWKQD